MLSDGCPVCLSVCLSACPVCNVGVVYYIVAKHWMDENETWRAGRPWSWPHCVRWGPSSPFPKGHSLQFSPHVYCGQTAVCISKTWYVGMPQQRRHCVTRGPSSPSPKGDSPQFSAHVRWGQSAGWIKMPLGTVVNLAPGDVVLDGVRASQTGTAVSPLFGPCLLWPRSPISATAELLWCFTCMTDCCVVLFYISCRISSCCTCVAVFSVQSTILI